MGDEKDTAVNSVPVKVNFRITGRMPTLYAHHMVVQPGEHEVTISFFEVVPPLITDNSEDQIKLLQEVGIVAECVARITVAKSRFPGFAQVMQQILSQMLSEQQDTEEK